MKNTVLILITALCIVMHSTAVAQLQPVLSDDPIACYFEQGAYNSLPDGDDAPSPNIERHFSDQICRDNGDMKNYSPDFEPELTSFLASSGCSGFSVTATGGTTICSGSSAQLDVTVPSALNSSYTSTYYYSGTDCDQSYTTTGFSCGQSNSVITNIEYTISGLTYCSSGWYDADVYFDGYLADDYLCDGTYSYSGLNGLDATGVHNFGVVVWDEDEFCDEISFTVTVRVYYSISSAYFTYAWSPSTGLSSTSVKNPVASPTSTTTYYVTVTAGGTNGCDATSSTTVTVNNPPSAPTSITNGGSTICTGGSVNLTASGGSEGTACSYQWFTGGCSTDAFVQGWETQPYSTGSTTVNSVSGGILNVTSTGIDPMIFMGALGSFDPNTYRYIHIRYRVTAGTANGVEIFFYNTDHNYAVGGETGYGSLISDNQWHVLSVDMGTDPDYFTGGNIVGWRYDWATASGVTMDIDYIALSNRPLEGTSSASSISVSPTSTTTYYVRRVGSSICTNMTSCASGSITVVSDPTLSAATRTNSLICAGGSSVYSSSLSNGTGTLSYQWQYSPNNSAWSNVATGTPTGANYTNPTATSMTVGDITANGTYYYRLSATTTGIGCTSPINSTSASVQVVSDPAVGTTAYGSSQICSGSSTTATATVSGGTGSLSYQWQYYNGASWANVVTGTPAGVTYTNPTSQTMTIGASTSAEGIHPYRLYVSNGLGCDASGTEANITIGNVIVSATVGTASGGYATLTTAFTAINAGTHKGVITINVACDVTSNTTATLNASVTGGNPEYTSVTIQPSGGAAKQISGSRAGNPLIDLNGADNVTIDGLNTGGNSLTLVNTSTSTTSGTSTIRLINSAENNTITNCTLKSAARSTGGAVLFSTASAGNGNDGNTISYNSITSNGTNRPTYLIHSTGSSGYDNSGNVISNNNFYNFFRLDASSYCIYVGNYSAAFTISGNSFYQTAEYTPTATISHYVINVSATVATGTNFIITDNYIGGSAPMCAGSPWTCSGNASTAFYAIQLNSFGASPVSSIQNNTIKNFSYSSTSAGPWTGIRVNGSGSADIGTSTANLIGESSGTGSITVVTPNPYGSFSPAAATAVMGVYGSTRTSGGSGYTYATVSFSGGGSPTDPATATANIVGGAVTSITITNPGSGYTSRPTVTISGDGSGAVYANATLKVVSINITNGGDGYAILPTFTFSTSGSSTGAAATAVLTSGVLTGYTITNNGVGYTSVPTITIVTGYSSTYGMYVYNNTGTVRIYNNTISSIQVGNSIPEYAYRFYGISSTGTAGIREINNNNIGSATSNSIAVGTPSTTTGIIAIYGIYNTATGSCQMNGNTVKNCIAYGTTASAVNYGIYKSGNSTAFDMSLNTVENLNSTANATMIGLVSSNASASGTISNNTVNNLNSSTKTNSVRGISVSAACNIYENAVSNITASELTTGYNVGMLISNGTAVQAYDNTINAIQGNAITTGYVAGISITAGTANQVYRNKIFDISSSSSSITTGTVNGINVSGSTASMANTIYNNLIGDIKAPSANSTNDVVRGINVINTGATSSTKLYYNTVNLNASSSGTNFSTTGVYHTTSSTATTAQLEMINNLIVNESTPKGSGKAVAYRRSSTTLTNYSTSSDNNSYYAGTPGSSRLIFYDGTNSDQTIDAFITRMSTRDQASVSNDAVFVSTTGADATFLHLDNDDNCRIDGKGKVIATYTSDYDSDARDASYPDMGADEVVTGYPANLATSPTTLPTNAYVWTGQTGTANWSTASNWIQYNGSSFAIPASAPNTTNANVYIRAYNTCVLENLPTVTVSSDFNCGNLIIESNGGLTVTGANKLIVNGYMTNDGTLTATGSPTIQVNGNWTNNGTFTPATSTVLLGGTGATINTGGVGAGKAFYNLTVTKTSGTATISTNNLDVDGNLSITSGTLSLSGSLSATIAGNWSQTGGNFTCNSSTITFDGTNSTITTTGAGTKSFNHLIIADAAALGSDIDVNGNLTINNGKSFSDGSSFSMTLAGNWTNNGTFTSGSVGTVTFDGSSSAVIGGSSSNTFHKVTLNKGTGLAAMVEVNTPMTLTNTSTSALTMTNGLLKINSSGVLNLPNASQTIGSAAGIEINGGTLNGGGATMVNNGYFKLTSGTVNIGTVAGNSFENRSSSKFYIESGTMNIAARLMFTAANTEAIISGGTLNLCTVGNTSSTYGAFNMVATANISITGNPLITFQNAGSGATPLDVNILNGTGTKSFSSGTLQFGNASTPAGQNFKINSAVPLYNIVINGYNNPTATLTGNLPGCNDVTINAGGTLNTSSYQLSLSGDWINNGTYTAGTGTVDFAGTSAQEIQSGSSAFNNVIFSNSTTGINDVNISEPMTINGVGTFTNGIVFYSGTGSLTFGNTGSTSGGSDNSFVNEIVTKTGTSAFTFPVGDTAIIEAAIVPVYAPVGIAAPASNSTITALYDFSKGPINWSAAYMCDESQMKYTSSVEHWDLTTTSATPAVTLYWTDATRSGITDLTDLAVAHFNGTCWEYKGGTTSGDLSWGSITSNINFSSYSPVSFGSKRGVNKLPVELTQFGARCGDDGILITWQTASETNNDYFTLEKSENAVDFIQIAEIQGAGNSVDLIEYHFLDERYVSGTFYYRLKQTDFDGSSKYSNIVIANCYANGSANPVVIAYPNPFNDELSVTAWNLPEGEITLTLTDLFGKDYYRKELKTDKGEFSITLFLKDIAPAVYLLKITKGEFTRTIKVVK